MKYPKRTQYKYAKTSYKIRNWSKYEAGLRQRGSLTIWLNDDVAAGWYARGRRKPGGQRVYADAAIKTFWTMRWSTTCRCGKRRDSSTACSS